MKVTLRTPAWQGSVEEYKLRLASSVAVAIRNTEILLTEVIDHVALKTGLMRSSIIEQMVSILNEAVVNDYSAPVLLLDLTDAQIELIALTVDYIVKHTRGMPQFNIIWEYGYFNPTTPGTRPFDRKESVSIFVDVFRTSVELELRRNGLL